MSSLTFIEKDKFEQLLGMGSGYVLGFSNRTFAEFVLDSTGRDIYDVRYEYGSGSKANRLRAFWKNEDDGVVGKLMKDVLDYVGDTDPMAGACRLIVARLLKIAPAQQPNASPQSANEPAQGPHRSHPLAELKEEFFRLAVENNRQKAGLALEKLLNRLFGLFQLHPRQPFRVVGNKSMARLSWTGKFTS